jgi:hypothetical protein
MLMMIICFGLLTIKSRTEIDKLINLNEYMNDINKQYNPIFDDMQKMKVKFQLDGKRNIC